MRKGQQGFPTDAEDGAAESRRYHDRSILFENLCCMVTAGLFHDSNAGLVEPRKRAVKDLEYFR